MPLYEYKCTACHKRTEKIQKFSDKEITTCPKCGGVLERVISAPAISFKGGGWFADGYGNAKPAAGTSSGSNGEGSSGDSTKSESKPASEGAASTSAPATAPATASTPAAAAPASKP